MASTPVTICNMALAHLGAESLVASIDPPDGSQEAAYCSLFYAQARAEALANVKPYFAQRRVLLTALLDNPTSWPFAYALPSDCLVALKVLAPPDQRLPASGYDYVYDRANTDDAITPERVGSRFEIRGRVLYSVVPEATLIYAADLEDTSGYSPQFTYAVSALLASYLCGPIIKGSDGVNAGAAWRKRATEALQVAAAHAANQSQDTFHHAPDMLAVR